MRRGRNIEGNCNPEGTSCTHVVVFREKSADYKEPAIGELEYHGSEQSHRMNLNNFFLEIPTSSFELHFSSMFQLGNSRRPAIFSWLVVTYCGKDPMGLMVQISRWLLLT
jgi:hypothetical protein